MSDTPQERSKKRSSSVLKQFGIKLFSRTASSSSVRATPPSSPLPSRSPSVTPSSPSLLPTTSTVTAPGTIVRTHSPSLDTHSFETRAIWLIDHLPALDPPSIVTNINELQRMLRLPAQTRPPFNTVYLILTDVCSWTRHCIVRQAGFSLLVSYLDLPLHDSPQLDDTLDLVALWHLASTVPPRDYVNEDDWEQRLKALNSITDAGRNVEGLSGLIPTLHRWSLEMVQAIPLPKLASSESSSDEELEQRINLERRSMLMNRLLFTICSHNVTILSESDEESAIITVMKAFDCALLATELKEHKDRSESPRRSSSSLPLLSRNSTRIAGLHVPSPLNRSTSRHKRNSSSQSSYLYPRTSPHSSATLNVSQESPSPTDAFSWIPQATVLVKTLSVLAANSPLPSHHVRPTIQALLLILGGIAAELPQITTIEASSRAANVVVLEPFDAELDYSTLESETWDLIAHLLSASYGSTTAYEIKRHVLSPASSKAPIEGRAVRRARGAARAIRLALRQGAKHRVALSRFEDLDDVLASPTLLSRSPSSELDGTARLYGAGSAGMFWDVSQAQDIMGRAVRIWLVALESSSAAPLDPNIMAIVLECIGVARDIVDECAALQRVISEEEARIVGEILKESVECLRIPPVPQLQHRQILAEAVSELLYSVPLSMPLLPESPAQIVLSVAEHIPDSKGVIVIQHIFREVLSFPSTEDWIPIIQSVLSKFHAAHMSQCRRVITQHIRQLYDEVRDLAAYRDPLIQCSLDSWERSLPKEDNEETVADILNVLGDAVVAGATEEQFLEPGSSHQMPNGLDHRIVDLLVHLGCMCDCPYESQGSATNGGGSDRATLLQASIYEGIGERERPWRLPVSPLPTSASASSSRDVSTSPSTPHHTFPHGHTVFDYPEPSAAEAPPSPSLTPTPRLDDGPPVPHDKGCKSMAAILMLIRTFNRLAFSPPHSLDSESPFKAARAPASSKCINVFENILSLLGPTHTTTSLPTGEERRQGHMQASCRRSRLAILQWVVRLRADRDHRLYFKEDLNGELEPFAHLISRGASDPTDGPGGIETGLDDIGRSGGRRTRHDPDFSRGRSQTPSVSRSRSRIPRPRDPTLSYDASQDALWSLPENLPFDAPSDATRPSEGMTTFDSDRREHDGVTPSLWLSVSTYVCILTDIMEDENDWEIFSYALCHLPLQLSNKHLFCGPRARNAITNMVSVMCSSILTDRLGGKIQIPVFLRATDVLGLAYQTLTIFVGYRDSFKTRERAIGEMLVSTFCYGLNRHVSIAKPSLQALAICAYEFESATAKYLPQALDLLVKVISNDQLSRQILELLAILGKMPLIHSNLRQSQLDMVFTTAGRYIQRHHRPLATSVPGAGVNSTKFNEGASFTLSQHVLVLAYYVVYIWFLGIERSERHRYITSILRHLRIANNDQSGMDEMSEVCLDWLKRYTAGDVTAKPSQDTKLCTPHQRSKSWLLGSTLMTIESLTAPGWAAVSVRGASGVVHLTVRVDNESTERFEEMDPFTLLPRGISEHIEGASDPQESLSTRGPLNGTEPNRALAVISDPKFDPSFLPLHLSRNPGSGERKGVPYLLQNDENLSRAVRILDITPVLELHKVGVLYVAPGQTTEVEILGNRTGSPAYALFLSKLGRIVKLRNQRTVYPAGLDTSQDIDGEFAYIWWDEISQIVFHATTMMPNMPHDPKRDFKKRHVGNDWVRVVWNDSGAQYRFDTLSTEFQIVNIIIEPHSAGITAAYSNSMHENEFFKITLQRAPGVPEFGPLGEFKLLSLQNLPHYVRQISLLASLFAQIYDFTKRDTQHEEFVTNWRQRLRVIKQLRKPEPLRGNERVRTDSDSTTDSGTADFSVYY